jgi:uncharacterized membrane protein YukC
MKKILMSAVALVLFCTAGAYAQSTTTEAEREARREARAQKIENSKKELREAGQKVGTVATELGRETKEKAKVVGKKVGTEAEKASEVIERKADDRKAKRGTTRRDTI